MSPLLGRFLDRHGLKSMAYGQVVIRAARPLADDHGAAAIAQVLGMGMALRAVAEDGDRLSLQQRQVGIFVVIDFGGHGSEFPMCMRDCWLWRIELWQD